MGMRKPSTSHAPKGMNVDQLSQVSGSSLVRSMHSQLAGTILALCTGYPHTYPQQWVRVDIMYIIGHSLCYPMGYDPPSPNLA